MIGDIKKFKFWCQKVLPLVYDDSLSYYEVLCKIVQYLNKVIEDVNSIPEYIDAVIDAKLSDEHLQELIEQFVLNIENAISSNNEGNNTNSSSDYNIGQMLWWNGKLYRVIRQIDAGDTFIVDTNIALVNFEDLFNEFVDEVKHDITANDDGGNTTATQNWTAGTWLWLNDVLYKVVTDIAQGNAYVFTGANANVEQITVESEIKNEATLRANAVSALQTAISDEATTRANADNALQTAITNEATSRDNAVSALQTAISDEATARTNADGALQNSIDNLNQKFIVNLKNRHFLFVGDSYGDDPDDFINLVITNLHLEDRGHNLAVSGAAFYTTSGDQYKFITQIQNYAGDKTAITDIIVCGGLNDSFSDDPLNSGYTQVQTAMGEFNSYVVENYPNAKVSLGYIGNGNDFQSGSYIAGRVYAARNVCRYIYYNMAQALGWDILHNVEYALCTSIANIGEDGVHPSIYGSRTLGGVVAEAILTGTGVTVYPVYPLALNPTDGSITNNTKYDIYNNITHIGISNTYKVVDNGVTINGLTSYKFADVGAIGFNKTVSFISIVRLDNWTIDGTPTTRMYVPARLTFGETGLYVTLNMAGTSGSGAELVSNGSSVMVLDETDIYFDTMILV